MKRNSKLYMRLFTSIMALVLIFQAALIAITSISYSRQSEKQLLGSAQDTLATSAEDLSSGLQRSIMEAYSLMYCQITQDCLNLNANSSMVEAKLKREALTDMLFVIEMSAFPGLDYTIVAEGAYSRNYTTISSSFIDMPAFDFRTELWFREFSENTYLRSAFYPEVSLKRYAKNMDKPVHAMLFRSNDIQTLRDNGYVIMQFTDETFASLLNSLIEISADVVVADDDGNVLFQSSGAVDADTLLLQAFRQDGKQYASQGGLTYIPLTCPVETMDWVICCAIDAAPINASLRTLLFSFLIVQAALIFSLLGLIYIVSRRLTRPLTRLADDVRGYHDGQLILHAQKHAGYCEEVDTLIQSMDGLSNQLNAARQKAKDYQQLQQSTAFYALQQQVNPHFLFNTLDMIIGMASQGDLNAIIFACSELSTMFRYSLSREATVLLRDEINYIRCYLDIIAMRSHNRIRGELDVDQGADLVRVPKLLLQPFVENSVKYGFEQTLKGGVVSVRVRREDTGIDIRIEDNGCGFSPAVLAQLKEAIRTDNADDVPNQHIGILNIYKRMCLLYGSGFSLSLDNGETGGAVILLRLPLDFPTMIV